MRVGLRGQLAGLGLATAALSYLEPNVPNGVKLHKNFAFTKDFIGTSLKGTIGAALAFLEMQSLGYVWQGHWEDCVATAGPPAARPDFVFAKNSQVCLVDAKGTSGDASALAKTEWKRQIYTNRKKTLRLGGHATEGRVIAVKLSTSASTELVTAYGSWAGSVTKGTATSSATPNAVTSVQRGNFVGALFLVGLPKMAASLMRTSDFVPSLDGSAVETNVENRDVYLGPTRMVVGDDNARWAMRPFCRAEVIRKIYDGALVGVDSDLPYWEPSLSIEIDAKSDEQSVVLESRDGVGARACQIFSVLRS